MIKKKSYFENSDQYAMTNFLWEGELLWEDDLLWEGEPTGEPSCVY